MKSPSPSRWPALLLHAGVVALIAILAGATFVLSYAGIRDLAVAAGQPWRMARLYPVIFDAVFVVACVAVVLLRDASPWRRVYAWACVVVLVGVIGAADVIHAMRVPLPRRPEAGTAAALPWALVMLGFSLWLTMMRHARSAPAPTASAPQDPPAEPQAPALPAAWPAQAPRAWQNGHSADETPADERPADAPPADAPPPLRRIRSTPLPPED